MTDFDNRTGEAEAAIRALEGPARETADAIDQAFAKAGQSLARSLARAASDGKLSMGELAAAVISAANGSGGFGLGNMMGDALGQAMGGRTGTAAPQVTVTLNMAGGASSLIRSEAQIASALNRAARMGVR